MFFQPGFGPPRPCGGVVCRARDARARLEERHGSMRRTKSAGTSLAPVRGRHFADEPCRTSHRAPRQRGRPWRFVNHGSIVAARTFLSGQSGWFDQCLNLRTFRHSQQPPARFRRFEVKRRYRVNFLLEHRVIRDLKPARPRCGLSQPQTRIPPPLDAKCPRPSAWPERAPVGLALGGVLLHRFNKSRLGGGFPVQRRTREGGSCRA